MPQLQPWQDGASVSAVVTTPVYAGCLPSMAASSPRAGGFGIPPQ